MVDKRIHEPHRSTGLSGRLEFEIESNAYEACFGDAAIVVVARLVAVVAEEELERGAVHGLVVEVHELRVALFVAYAALEQFVLERLESNDAALCRAFIHSYCAQVS